MIYRDLSFYHRIDLLDVIEGRGPSPRVVFWLIQGLPDTSMLAAMLRGGLHYLGWGEDREIAAQQFNAMQLNTRATGNWKKKPPDLPEWPKPKPFKPKSKPSLANLSAKLRGPGAYKG